MSKIQGINSYYKELSLDDIKNKVHRNFVGGHWEKLGKLQLDFLIEYGLKPNHKLLDLGCGCLRGGIYFLDYLDAGNYFGLDINSSLIEAGKVEVQEANLSSKIPNLLVDDSFSIDKFGCKFDYIFSLSLFTHLPFNMIVRCLVQVKKHLNTKGTYYSTFFEAQSSAHITPVKQMPGNITTNYDSDPFHYSVEELAFMSNIANLKLEIIGDWNHPRNQKMAAFIL
jgi:hypothetical protein